MSVLIIGTGFAGLGMAIKLKQAGIDDFELLEQASEVGGTWRDNLYPGCACDVRSDLYSFSFELNPAWSRSYAPQGEILAYLKQCAEKYGIRPHIRFGQRVVEARYDPDGCRWRVRTQDGQTREAAVVVAGMGFLSVPSMPELPGRERFTGAAFHSARWDHDCDLRGKRVAVIGTGASAIQFVPGIVDRVARIDLYQRTPPWVFPREDHETTPARRILFRLLPAAQRIVRESIYWSAELRALAMARRPELLERPEKEARRFIASQVADPELRRKVTPDYSIGCKRVLLSNDWYAAITRDHVEVIAEGIDHINETGVHSRAGRQRDVDAIIYGTGFAATRSFSRGTFIGPGGRDLVDAWGDLPEAYKGTTIAGFPNLFMLAGPNTGIGHTSMVYMLEAQLAYVMDALERMRTHGWKSLDVRPEVQRAFNAELRKKSGQTVWLSGCKSWYLNENGQNFALWPDFTFRFRQRTARFDPDAYIIEEERSGRAAPRRDRIIVRPYSRTPKMH